MRHETAHDPDFGGGRGDRLRQAAAAGTRTPDAPTSHTVDPGEPPATGGGASWVTPVPGDGPSNPVHPIAIHTHLNGSSGVAVVTWWGGVAPCYVLRASVSLTTAPPSGSPSAKAAARPPGPRCIEMAQLKRTRVDLGHLAPGRYTVIAGSVRSHLVIAG